MNEAFPLWSDDDPFEWMCAHRADIDRLASDAGVEATEMFALEVTQAISFFQSSAALDREDGEPLDRRINGALKLIASGTPSEMIRGLAIGGSSFDQEFKDCLKEIDPRYPMTAVSAVAMMQDRARRMIKPLQSGPKHKRSLDHLLRDLDIIGQHFGIDAGLGSKENLAQPEMDGDMPPLPVMIQFIITGVQLACAAGDQRAKRREYDALTSSALVDYYKATSENITPRVVADRVGKLRLTDNSRRFG